MQREIKKIYQNTPVINNGLLRLYRLLPINEIQSLGPFVFVDYYSAIGGGGIGQGAHPHAGIEVVSYLIKGHGQHRDSKGFVDEIKTGEAQHIKAGSGIIHSETPLVPVRQGLQLWLSLPPAHLFDEPTYASYRSDMIPEFKQDNALVRVVAGNLNNLQGPVSTVNESLLVHVHTEDKNEITLQVKEGIELGVMLVNGQVSMGGKKVSVGDLAVLGDGNTITIQPEGNDSVIDLAILGGAKITYPLVFDGPFVMDSEANIIKAYQRYHNGSMGHLE